MEKMALGRFTAVPDFNSCFIHLVYIVSR